MTTADDIGALGFDVLLATFGISLTYTEAGDAAQAATGLERNFRQIGPNGVLDFAFKAGALTVSNWQGAKITGSEGKAYTVQDQSSAPGHIQFVAQRPLERS